ncbi:MAG: hypothetical protein ABI661_10960 [Gammaproteobacteria bacterium]
MRGFFSKYEHEEFMQSVAEVEEVLVNSATKLLKYYSGHRQGRADWRNASAIRSSNGHAPPRALRPACAPVASASRGHGGIPARRSRRR